MNDLFIDNIIYIIIATNFSINFNYFDIKQSNNWN